MKIIRITVSAILLSVFIYLAFITKGFNLEAKEYPNYDGYVNDFADILSEDYEKRLEEELAKFDQDTTNEIVVVTVSSLEGDSIEHYSIELAEQWKIGKAKTDNGVIFLTAVQDRRTRIEVGYGNEEHLTDIESGRILDDLKVYYRNGDYEGGVSFVIGSIKSNLVPGEPVPNATIQTGLDGGEILILLLMLLVVGFPVGLALIAASPFTPIGGQGTWGITDVYSYSDDDDDDSGGGFFSSGGGSGFSSGGGSFGGGGGSGSW